MPLPESCLPPRRRSSEWWRLGLAFILGLAVWVAAAPTTQTELDADFARAMWIICVDPVLGLGALTLSHWRHRWPVPVALIVLAVSVGSLIAAGAYLLVVVSIGTRRRPQEMLGVGAAAVATAMLSGRIYPNGSQQPHPIGLLITSVGVIVVCLAVGYAIGSRRDSENSLRLRAETAEREQATRVAAAQVAERSRIAREMHDVLAHRISLVAMHAGALSYREDLSREEQQAAIRTIEENARQALVDLRDVLGVLRDPATTSVEGAPAAPTEAPQPTLAVVPALVAEARSSGMQVTLTDTTAGEPTTTTGRTAFRIVQEGLTNARKHAPKTHVRVDLSGDPEAGLTVTIRTPRALARPEKPLPASGLGLVGLRERMEIAGGRLRHEVDRDGDFVLTGWLPWT